MYYNRKKEGVENMDVQVTKRLNKQGVWFVVLHTLVIFNFAADFMLIH
jgi:hypothetical protein